MKFNPLKDQTDGLRFLKFESSIFREFYSIGDIHGCAHELETLLRMIDKDAASRGKLAMKIVHGDAIDRGPEFSLIFKILLCSPNTFMLLGNHEHNFVLERIGKPCNSASRKVSHDRFDAMKKGHQLMVMAYLNRLSNFAVIEDAERTFVLTHAPLKNMEQYTDWKPLLYTGNAPYFCMRSSVPIDEDMERKQQDVTFVYGHQSWEYKDIEEQKNEQIGRRTQYYNIDAGCVYGGQLVALRLSDLGVLFVDSKVKVAK